MKATVTKFVVDASVVMSWFFESEKTSYTEWVLNKANDGAELVVPCHWPLEIINTFLVAERRKKFTPAQSQVFLDQLEHFNIILDTSLLSTAFSRVMTQARQWHLSSYDAAYLELALRTGHPLATLDEALKKAAKAVGVLVLHKESSVD